ncbi:MAG: tetratricopeptide repeat protein [Candidatus ainarchaeum sp.]|nr:tetratricopeptide repeat protein [Candidatus ainarchaeum sp.]
MAEKTKRAGPNNLGYLQVMDPSPERARERVVEAVKHGMQGDLKEMEVYLLKAIRADEKNPDAHRFLADLHLLNRNSNPEGEKVAVGKAIAEYEKAIALDPSNPHNYFGLSEAYAVKGDEERRKEYLKGYLGRVASPKGVDRLPFPKTS